MTRQSTAKTTLSSVSYSLGLVSFWHSSAWWQTITPDGLLLGDEYKHNDMSKTHTHKLHQNTHRLNSKTDPPMKQFLPQEYDLHARYTQATLRIHAGIPYSPSAQLCVYHTITTTHELASTKKTWASTDATALAQSIFTHALGQMNSQPILFPDDWLAENAFKKTGCDPAKKTEIMRMRSSFAGSD